MLKRILSILAATLALSAETLCAYVHPNYEKGECWGVGAEYLYWLPDIDNTIFVAESIPTSGGIIGPLIDNNFGFHSGFRVEGAFALDCTSDLQIRYARFRCNTNKTVTGPALWQVGMFDGLTTYAGSASSDLDFYYQNVELLYANRVWDSGFSHFYVLGGLQYYYFSLSEDLFYVAPGVGSDFVDRSCHNYGIGPEIGFEFICPLNLCWCGWEEMNIAIVGQASGSLLAHHTHIKFANDIITYDVEAQNIWRVVPALNARAGLQYASTCWCIDFDIEIGYEFTSYFRSLERAEIISGAATFQTRFYNVDMQGLYVAVGLNF